MPHENSLMFLFRCAVQWSPHKVTIRPKFFETVPIFEGLSWKKYEVIRDAKLSRIPNPVPNLSWFIAMCQALSSWPKCSRSFWRFWLSEMRFVELKTHQIHFRPGLCPDPTGGAYDAPRSLSQMGRVLSLPIPLLPRSSNLASRKMSGISIIDLWSPYLSRQQSCIPYKPTESHADIWWIIMNNSECGETLRYLTSFCICQNSDGRSAATSGRRSTTSSSSSLSEELSSNDDSPSLRLPLHSTHQTQTVTHSVIFQHSQPQHISVLSYVHNFHYQGSFLYTAGGA